MSSLSFEAVESAFWLSLFAAPLGSLLIFRRLSFFGDALSHASLSGIAVVYLMAGASAFWLPLGALVSVLITAGLLHWLEKKARLPSDVALTCSYSGMFALGVLLVSSSDLDLEHLLIGDIWHVSNEMLWFLRGWAIIVLLVLWRLWKPLWASVMDPRFARGLGYSMGLMDLLFLCLTAVSVVGMIQSVGVILVAAYLVLPAASLLFWVRSLKALVLGSIFFALFASGLGLLLSATFGFSAGPSIAFLGFLLFLLSHILKNLRSMRVRS